LAAPSWTFLTNHARVLLCIAHDPGVRLRDIAARLDITERSAYGIVTDLALAGYIVKQKDGRRNRYQIQRTSRCRNPPAGSAPWARCWPCSPTTTRPRDGPGCTVAQFPLRTPGLDHNRPGGGPPLQSAVSPAGC